MRRLLLLLCLLLVTACGGDEETAAPVADEGAVQDLDNVLALRSDFEAAAGKTRVIILFSPT